MQFDRKEQQTSILNCIRMAASHVRFDASEEVFTECAAFVKLRREVEQGEVPVQAPALEVHTQRESENG
jgi:hypothetical protein